MKLETHLFIVLINLVHILQCSLLSAQQCKTPKNSEYGYTLLSSAYLVLTNEDLGSCYLKCIQDPQCSSINFNLTNGKCEHSHMTKQILPSRFVRKELSLYAEAPESGAHSCRHLQKIKNGIKLTDGIYRLYPNGVSSPPFMAYCDMTRDGGGWTLLVTSQTNTWSAANVLLRNAGSPSVTNDYSILKYADDIKNHVNVGGDKFEYRLEANQRGHWGGVWKAPRTYTFTAKTSAQTNVKLVKRFDNWAYSDQGIEQRMPWISGEKLTTSSSAITQWWGSITGADGTYIPAPWMNTNPVAGKTPGRIWYWMREGLWNLL